MATGSAGFGSADGAEATKPIPTNWTDLDDLLPDELDVPLEDRLGDILDNIIGDFGDTPAFGRFFPALADKPQEEFHKPKTKTRGARDGKKRPMRKDRRQVVSMVCGQAQWRKRSHALAQVFQRVRVHGGGRRRWQYGVVSDPGAEPAWIVGMTSSKNIWISPFSCI